MKAMIRIQIRTAMMSAMAVVALAAVSLAARAADPVQLTSVDVQTLSGSQVQLKLHMSGPAPEPLPFTIDKPARIAFDLPNTTLALAQRRIDVRSGGVDTVLAAEANGRARLVVNVDNLMPYTTKVDGDTITVTLGQQPGADVGKPVAARVSVGTSAAPTERAIRTIDFRRGSDGTGRVIVQLTDPRTPVNVRQEGNQIVVDFAGTVMPKNLMRRYDVMDFATPVQTVDAVRVDGSSRLVISSQGDFEQLAYQSDNQYTVEIKPSTKRSAQEEKKEYTGERLTLNFQDIDVRSVLQLLADTSGQNIVVSDSVSGNLTLRLQNVPWDQALDIVLRTKGLDKRRQDNVIIIGPTEELASRGKGRTRRAQRSAGAVGHPHGIHAGQLCQGRGPGEVDQGQQQQGLDVVDARHSVHRRAHQHSVGSGHFGEAGGYPQIGANLGRAGQTSVDRSAHRDRQRHL